MTGVSFYNIPVTGKRLALLHELVPKAEIIAVLQDPNSATFQTETREIEAAARAIGQKIIIVKARNQCSLFDRGQVRCRRSVCGRWCIF